MDEFSHLLRHARGTVHHDVIYVLARTGVRGAELAALRWEAVLQAMSRRRTSQRVTGRALGRPALAAQGLT